MWREPVRGSLPDPSFYSLPGIDQLRAYLDGLAPRPPLGHLVGLMLTQVGSGTATGRVRATPWLEHAGGSQDVKMMLESILDVAALTGVPPASQVSTVSLSVNHLRPATMEGQSFVARARVVHTGRTYTLTEALMEDALGRAVAHATGSHVIRQIDPPPPPSGPLAPVEEPSYPSAEPYRRPLPAGFLDPTSIDEMTALDIGQKVMAGELPPPPIHELMGFRFVEVAEGAFSVVMPATGWFCRRHRRVSAGPIACLAHLALTGAPSTLAPAGRWPGIVEQSISFLRQVDPDGRELLARGRVTHQVGDLHVATVEVTDADGALVAVGHQTSRLVARRPPGSRGPEAQRVLATVVFTDIVGSTKEAERLGDAAWQRVLADHDALVRRQLGVWKGREVKTLGDGFLVTFDSPARAVQFGRAVRDEVRRLGLEVRVGVHTGECQVQGGDVTGIAVHVAARVQAAAEPGEVLVSSTVRGLVAGSGLRFTDRGRHELKGVEGDWHLFGVVD